MRIREYRKFQLDGGTLVVSVPYVGMGASLLTDWILEQHAMDHCAAVDSRMFPPLAMLRGGKARFPLRIHADPAARVAVLRGDFPVAADMARPVAEAVLEWADNQNLGRIVTLDGLYGRPRGNGGAAGAPAVWFAATDEKARKTALNHGLKSLDEGVLGAVPAMLQLLARFHGHDVVSLFAEIATPMDDARSVPVLAHALPAFVAGLTLDVSSLERDLAGLEAAVRRVQEEAAKAATRLGKQEPGKVAMYV